MESKLKAYQASWIRPEGLNFGLPIVYYYHQI
jgi:hypothetical protein